MNCTIFQKLFAELIGTFILAMVVLITLTPSTPFPLATPIAAALTLGLAVYLIGNVSGCHINPAISFAMLIFRQISLLNFIGYVIFQVIGAFLAYLLVLRYVPIGQEQWLFVHHSTLFSGIGEALGAAFFAFGVLTTVYNKNINQMMSGFIVGTSLLIGLTISHNASYGILNPAVALATKAWGWDYLLMPFIGACVGALVSRLLFCGSTAK
ncbi:MAG: aquaporin [Pseudomonadota bacterium]